MKLPQLMRMKLLDGPLASGVLAAVAQVVSWMFTESSLSAVSRC